MRLLSRPCVHRSEPLHVVQMCFFRFMQIQIESISQLHHLDYLRGRHVPTNKMLTQIERDTDEKEKKKKAGGRHEPDEALSPLAVDPIVKETVIELQQGGYSIQRTEFARLIVQASGPRMVPNDPADGSNTLHMPENSCM